MECVTSRTPHDDIERLKRMLVRKGEGTSAVHVATLHSQRTQTTDITLTDESFLLYMTYPSLNDALILARAVCKRYEADDCVAVAQQMRLSRAILVDFHFAIIFAAWITVNRLSIDDAISLEEDTARQLLDMAWTHAPTHRFATSQLRDAVKLDVTFAGAWDTSKLGGGAIAGKSVRQMVENLTYAGEPIFDALERLKKSRFATYETRCAADLKERCFGTH